MTEGDASRALEDAGVRAGDVVVIAGPELEALLLGALERIGEDGAVIAVEHSPDRLEALRSRCADPRVSYLIGDAGVLPLPDGSADVVLATGAIDEAELDRVARRRRGVAR